MVSSAAAANCKSRKTVQQANDAKAEFSPRRAAPSSQAKFLGPSSFARQVDIHRRFEQIDTSNPLVRSPPSSLFPLLLPVGVEDELAVFAFHSAVTRACWDFGKSP